MGRRIISTFIALNFILIVLLTNINVAFSQTPQDTINNAAQILKTKGVLSGDSKGNLNLDKPLKRSEISKIMVAVLGKSSLADTLKNTGKSSFKDIKSTHWALGYIEAAKMLNIINGFTDGTFKPEDYLKTEQLVSIIVRALGYKDSDLIGKWPLNYINKGYDLGLYKGIEETIDVGANVTRGQTAAMIYNAFYAKEYEDENPISIQNPSSTEVVIKFDKDVKGLDKSNFTIDNNLTVFDANYQDNNKSIVVLKTSEQTANIVYKLSYKGKQTKLTFIGKESPFDIYGSISSDSLKRINVSFTKPINKTSIDSDSVKIFINDNEDITCKRALSQDGKMLTLVLTNKANQSDNIKIMLNNIKSTDGKTLTTQRTFTLMDTVQPKVIEVKVINSKKLRIYFNEPMQVNTNGYYKISDRNNISAEIKIDSQYVYSKITSVDEENAIDIENYSVLADGSHTLEITEAKDYANYRMIDYKTTITTVLDKNPPKAIGTEIVSNNKVRITFDEEINSINGIPEGEFEILQAGDNTNLATNATKALYNEKTIEVTFVQGNKFDVRSIAGVDIKYRNVRDLIGNINTNWQVISTKAQDDTTKPQVKYVEVLEGNTLKVVFSKAVDAKDKNLLFKLYKEDALNVVENAAKSIVSIDGNYPSDTYLVEFDSLSNINSGRFVLKISGLKDTSIRENIIDDYQTVIVAKDSQPPLIVGAISKYDSQSDSDRIEVVFSEPMDTTLLQSLSSYFVGNGSATVPLSTVKGAKVETISANQQKIVLLVPKADDTTPNKWSQTGGIVDKIAAPTLKDKAGNILANATISTPYTITANYQTMTPADIEVKAIDKNTIIIKALNGKAFSQVNPNGIMFRNAYANTELNNNADNDKIVNLNISYAELSQDKTQITLKTINSLTSDAKADSNDSGVDPEPLKFYLLEGALKDQFEQNISIPPTLDVNFYPSIRLLDGISANQKDISVGTDASSDTIIISFDENVTLIDGITNTVLAAGIDIKDGNLTLIPELDYTAYIQNGNIFIKVIKPNVVDKTLTIEIKRPDLIVDSSGNPVIPSKATQVAHVTERIKPVANAEFYSNDLKKVKITFSEPMDANTLIKNNFSCVAGGNIVNFVKSSDNRWVEITFTNNLNAGAVILLNQNIKDLAGNSISNTSITK
ncbi:S-layer homology domain-containing protein [Caldicellulosiruptoraceae bacterium PP1]